MLMTPNYRIKEEILNLVQEISEKSTQLSFGKRELHLRKENRIRSIQSSLAIENNSLTLEQVTDIIEVTPAGTLVGLAKRAMRGVPFTAINAPEDLEKFGA